MSNHDLFPDEPFRTSRQAALDIIVSNRLQIANAEDNIWLAVRLARETGASWADVGLALGVTRQAAQGKYADVSR